MSKVLKDTDISLVITKEIVNYDESFSVTITATGGEARKGLQIPYRILNGPSPFGSDLVLIDFTYDKDIDYYYLHVILSDNLGSNTVTVEQIDGDVVQLEKVSDLVYKYKNPLDKYEITRTFRATLKTINNTDDLIKGVRAFDFIYSNEYGFFELDEQLTATKTFKNKIHHNNEIDRVFNLSLYYMPQYSVSALFTNNYIPPTPYPPYVSPKKPKITIEAISTNIYEGEDAIFKINYENIRKNFKINYEWIDTKDGFIYSDFFTTNGDGFSFISIKTSIVGNTNATRYIRLWIKDYPKIENLVYLNSLPDREYEEQFLPGIYSIPLYPFLSYSCLLVSAGGAGGASVNIKEGNFDVNAKGGDGGDTFLEIDDHSVKTYGAKGGTQGKWYTDTVLSEGQPGDGGVFNIYNVTDVIFIEEAIPGNNGKYSLTSPTKGGESVMESDIFEGYDGSGGNGGIGLGKDTTAPGGAGGGGALVKFTLTNNTSNIKYAKLTVGSGGVAYDLSSSNTLGNTGSNGLHGFARVKSL